MKKVFGFGLLMAAVMMVAFASCKKDPKVDGVTLSATTKSIKVDEEFTLKATVTPADAKNKAVTWESDKPAVATVDKNGKVKGIAAGEATITVTTVENNKTATCKVTVTAESTPDDPEDPFGMEPKEKTTIQEEWTNARISGKINENLKSVTLMGVNDNSLALGVQFFVNKDATKLPEGTYTVVGDNFAENTIVKSIGFKNDGIYYSFVGKVSGKNLVSPVYFFDGGTATVTATEITFNVTSHFGSTLKLKYTGSLDITAKSGAPMKAFPAIR